MFTNSISRNQHDSVKAFFGKYPSIKSFIVGTFNIGFGWKCIRKDEPTSVDKPNITPDDCIRLASTFGWDDQDWGVTVYFGDSSKISIARDD
jgi:hypothetical protein